MGVYAKNDYVKDCLGKENRKAKTAPKGKTQDQAKAQKEVMECIYLTFRSLSFNG